MNSLTLSEILQTHRKVVLDTSSIYLSKGLSPTAEHYNQQVHHFIAQDSQNPSSQRKITTIPSVIDEVSALFAGPNGHRYSSDDWSILSLKMSTLPSSFERIFNFLYPYSIDCGITDRTKKYPDTDVSLASLALAFSHEQGNFAFCSRDRTLNEFTFQAFRMINSYIPHFPFKLQGNLHIFTLFPSGDFIPYIEERKRESFEIPLFPEGFSFLHPSPSSSFAS